MNKKLILISLLISNTAMAEKLPDFLDSADIENASFVWVKRQSIPNKIKSMSIFSGMKPCVI